MQCSNEESPQAGPSNMEMTTMAAAAMDDSPEDSSEEDYDDCVWCWSEKYYTIIQKSILSHVLLFILNTFI